MNKQASRQKKEWLLYTVGEYFAEMGSPCAIGFAAFFESCVFLERFARNGNKQNAKRVP